VEAAEIIDSLCVSIGGDRNTGAENDLMAQSRNYPSLRSAEDV